MHIRTEFEDNYLLHLYAEENDTIYGFIDAEIEPMELCITCIYVEEPCRRMGIATMLLDRLCDVIYKNDLYIGITLNYVLDENLKSLDAFLKDRKDFVFEEDCTEYTVSPDTWKHASLVKKLRDRKGSGCKLGDLSPVQFREMKKLFSDYSLPVKEATEESKDYYDPELSQVLFHKGSIQAGLLARILDKENKIIEISSLACRKDMQFVLPQLLSSFCQIMFQKYSDFEIRTLAINSSSTHIVEKLFGTNIERNTIKSAIWL